MKTPTRIALLGTGMAAAAFYDRLSTQKDLEIDVFDKSRGIGGRLTTRYTETHQFDHGAQFFTARTPAFKAFLRDTGHVEPWTPNITTLSATQAPFKRIWFEPHYVATPRMNGLCKQMFSGARLTLGMEIARVEQSDAGLMLVATDGSRYGPYQRVVSSAPAEQTARIFSEVNTTPFPDVSFDPCFALMLPLSAADKLPSFDAAVVKDSIVNWLAFTDSKPGRDCAPSLIAHSDGAWARAHFEHDPADVKQQMAEAAIALANLTPQTTENAILHRWRYARTTQPLGEPYWLAEDQRLAACGDWCLGDRVEDAFTSGRLLAGTLAVSA